MSYRSLHDYIAIYLIFEARNRTHVHIFVFSDTGGINNQASSFVILIIGFIIRVPRQVPLMEQGPPTLPEHLCSLLIFSGLCVDHIVQLHVFTFSFP